jgi:AcrR family transcriptional regulator
MFCARAVAMSARAPRALTDPASAAPWPALATAELPERLAAPPRQQRGRERQQALIEAGLRLSAERNWADVTIGDIAAAIGCSIGTFYTRFHTKDAYFDVLLGLVAETMLRRTEAFHAEPARHRESAAEFVARWVQLAVNSFRLHRGLYAAAVLDLRRLTPQARAASPLVRLRDRSRALLLQTMARRPGWGSEAARSRLLFAHQLAQGVLINAVLTNPGPLRLDDPAFEAELVVAVCAYLGLPQPATDPPAPRARRR